jgi:hypothetical protein
MFDPPEADKCLLAFGELDVQITLYFVLHDPLSTDRNRQHRRHPLIRSSRDAHGPQSPKRIEE